MVIAIGILVTLATFIVMEGVTWCTHKYVMHGFLWYLHSDHHKKDHDHALERNDAFFLIFALPSMLLMLGGLNWGLQLPFFWIGLGIFIYGMAYLFVHDIFIHQRIKLFRNSRNVYFMALRRAHKIHHKHLEKEEGECYGMLFVPMKYFRDARSQLARSRTNLTGE